MGREVRRVPANFDWPIREIWKGFLNPHYQHAKDCPFCDHSGLNPETKKISDEWYAFDDHSKRWSDKLTQDEVDALIKQGRLMDFTHTWTSGKGWAPKKPKPQITAEMVNEWSRQGIGHDGINQWICVETRAKRLGVYGKCLHCKGEGILWRTVADKKAHDAWKPTPVPKGRWYQMWETTTEGSPISPAFKTPEELAQWLASNGASSFGHQTESYETWLKFIMGPGWAPTMVMAGGHIASGVAAVPK